MARPTALIQSSFSLSESAMKNMLSSVVEISKAWGLLMVSSAPLMDRHFFTCGGWGGRANLFRLLRALAQVLSQSAP